MSRAKPPPKPHHERAAFQTAPKAGTAEGKQREEEKWQERVCGAKDQEAGTGWTVARTPIPNENHKSTRWEGHGFEWLLGWGVLMSGLC